MKALITGIFGQDGSYLCELLNSKGYDVVGIAKSDMSLNSKRIEQELLVGGSHYKLYNNADICDPSDLSRVLLDEKPDEIYHIAAIHTSSEKVRDSADKYAFENNVRATGNILECCYNILNDVRIFTAGSCLMYDGTDSQYQDETTLYNSCSYYGIGKITENMLVKMYREKGLYCCTGILYNHESHRRAPHFVTQKIVSNLIRVKQGEIDSFTLGDINAKKDWGYAGDYVKAMWKMLQQGEPKDYIISSGTNHTIEEFIELVSKRLDIDDWRKHVIIDESIIKRNLRCVLKGDNSKIREELGWTPCYSLEDIVNEMVEYGLK